MCLSPKWIYKKGKYKKDNYNGLEGDIYEIGAYTKCGCCEQCMNEKSNNWVVRNYYESKAHEKISFITLTYEKNPVILVRKDLQDFIKRLRRYLDYRKEKKVRIFQCGEYGTLNGRPHYHITVYGWTDEDAKFLDVNKRKNIVYQSQIIQNLWGKGRTSYQEFNMHEIPYITLYSTPAETFKRAYKMTREKAKSLKEYYKSYLTPKERKNVLKELAEIVKEMDTKKAKYYAVKEFNGWSQALGWAKFEEEYYKSSNYTWVEYIENKEFVTPSPWVKKLANIGDVAAIEEMRRRENEIEKCETTEEERTKNNLKYLKKRRKELKEWIETKDKIEYL